MAFAPGSRFVINPRTATLAPLASATAAAAVACSVATVWLGNASAHEPDADESALVSLVDAELAFARMAHEQGVRAAFLANFAADGIVFEPAPVRLQEAWSVRPTPADPKALRLAWQPAQAGLARSRDMGYTTGPFTLIDTARADGIRQGVFFSVWQRKADGPWQVLLNVNTVTPEAVDFVPFGAAPRPHYPGPAEVKEQRRRLLDREAHAVAVARAGSSAAAYATLLAPDARVYRDGMAPLAGLATAAAHLRTAPSRITWSPIDVRVSNAGDMAVSYGKFREIGPAVEARAGYYVHLWLRDGAGQWRLAYDIAAGRSL